MFWCGGTGGQEADQRLAHCTINVINPFLTLTRTREATDKCTVGAIHHFSGTSGRIFLYELNNILYVFSLDPLSYSETAKRKSITFTCAIVVYGPYCMELLFIFTTYVYPHLHSVLIMSTETETYPRTWPGVQWTGTLMVLVLLIWPQWAGLQDAGRWTRQREGSIGIASIQRAACVASRWYRSPSLL